VIGHFFVPKIFHFATKKKGLPRCCTSDFLGQKYRHISKEKKVEIAKPLVGAGSLWPLMLRGPPM
jgi:hypothetical protein